ncbi:5-formyltetrahydrofolate cyclo-ligase [Bacillus sp. FJAT-22090]|uniref:5-formyltetrahydrofolate cyclo-ligase n=1 Tax=Bacillus sp. FJAT-22090 TaxID=1581038 RepID=UPI00119D5802|nr:5-formyltetrahydrofolate cyclo-ligase [Bacillus sp. FJAT-22090]
MSKLDQRKNMKDRLAELKMDLYSAYSKEIENHFLIEENVQNASVIGMTISSFPEVDTKGIIQQLWKMGKTVVVPKCTSKDRSMTFYKIESYDQLETVYMQLLEPNPLLTTKVAREEIDLLVVPGIVYSKKGCRIGYGGGYYDRFLMNYAGQTMSLAFDFQIVEKVMREPFDLPVDTIITNKEIIPCKRNREKEV